MYKSFIIIICMICYPGTKSKLCNEHAPAGVPSFSQKPLFCDALAQVLNHTRPSGDHLSSCPNLPAVAHVLLHVLEEWECYVGLQSLVARQGWIDRNPVESTASLLTLTKLLSTHSVIQMYINFTL